MARQKAALRVRRRRRQIADPASRHGRPGRRLGFGSRLPDGLAGALVGPTGPLAGPGRAVPLRALSGRSGPIWTGPFGRARSTAVRRTDGCRELRKSGPKIRPARGT